MRKLLWMIAALLLIAIDHGNGCYFNFQYGSQRDRNHDHRLCRFGWILGEL